MRTRLDRSRARGLSKFVGRDDEMERLETALRRALDGDGQAVGLMAEAGSGKSRLCYEFLERCRSRGITVRPRPASLTAALCRCSRSLSSTVRFTAARPTTPMRRRARRSPVASLAMAPEELESLPLLYDFMRVPDPAQPAPDLVPTRDCARSWGFCDDSPPRAAGEAGRSGVRGFALDRPRYRDDRRGLRGHGGEHAHACASQFSPRVPGELGSGARTISRSHCARSMQRPHAHCSANPPAAIRRSTASSSSCVSARAATHFSWKRSCRRRSSRAGWSACAGVFVSRARSNP